MNRKIGIVSPAMYVASSSTWTVEENKRFENALALFDRDTPDRWHNVASMVPGKNVNDVIQRYRELVEDVVHIEAGLIPVPRHSNNSYCPASATAAAKCNDYQQRKKGVPWTEDEHRQFLLGLIKYGKGDWRNISRNFVTTRTPTQVASHAQKYFIRHLSGEKDKKRSSIHDITIVNLDQTMQSAPSPEKDGSDSLEKQQQQQQQRCLDGDVVVQTTNMTAGHLQGNCSSPSPAIGINLHQHFLHPLQSITDPHGLLVYPMNPVLDIAEFIAA